MSCQTKITSFFKPINQTNNVSDHHKHSAKTQKTNPIELNANLKVIKKNTLKHNWSVKNALNTQTKKSCPFYKRVPNTGFVVDAFCYGSVEGVSAYFLTHFHSDHYNGLTKNFSHAIYCTPITARLAINQFRIDERFIRTMLVNECRVIDGTRVTFIEANHCPGAVMILFVTEDHKTYLHTGDFRACHDMRANVELNKSQINTIFLDTTYCDSKYDFPSQKQCLDLIVSITSRAVNSNSKLLIICGTYSIGKENVFMAIANALKLNVWTDYYKQKIYKCYDDTHLNSLLVSNKHQSKLHVLPINNVNFKYLSKYLQDFKENFNEILAFVPTGWQFKNSLTDIKPRKSDNITIYGIPYSEHSSLGELKQFIQHFKPLKVIPTVNNGNQQSRKKMNDLVESWLTN